MNNVIFQQINKDSYQAVFCFLDRKWVPNHGIIKGTRVHLSSGYLQDTFKKVFEAIDRTKPQSTDEFFKIGLYESSSDGRALDQIEFNWILNSSEDVEAILACVQGLSDLLIEQSHSDQAKGRQRVSRINISVVEPHFCDRVGIELSSITANPGYKDACTAIVDYNGICVADGELEDAYGKLVPFEVFHRNGGSGLHTMYGGVFDIFVKGMLRQGDLDPVAMARWFSMALHNSSRARVNPQA